MKRVADFIVEKRYLILTVMLIIGLSSIWMMSKVNVQTDMTQYLPDDSTMRSGLDLMEQEFGETETDSSIRVMFQDLTEEECNNIKKELQAIDHVNSVTYEKDNKNYQKTEDDTSYSLFVVNSEYEYDSPEMEQIETTISDTYSDTNNMIYEVNDGAQGIPTTFLVLAISLLIIILLIMCGSWLEPFLFLATIGVAVVINNGTNALLPSVSATTNAITAILQLVLSMDYSVILMNRYRQEKVRFSSKQESMKYALANSFSSITSSAVTTIVGLLALVFMSFKIGADMGIVLAKGVLISLICIFTILPVLVLLFDGWITKTTKRTLHIPMKGLQRFSSRFHHVITGVFVVLFVAIYLMKGSTNISYGMASERPISKIFPEQNTIVMLYENKDEDAVTAIAEAVEDKYSEVEGVSNYSTTIGKEYTAKELSDIVGELSSDMEISPDLIRMLYYNYYEKENLGAMQVSDFINFVVDDVMENDAFADFIDEDMKSSTGDMKKYADAKTLTAEADSKGIADYFGMKEDDVKQLLLNYYVNHGGVDTGKMTLPVFAEFVVNEVAKDETFKSMFDAATLASLDTLATFTDAAKMTAANTYTETAELLGLDKSSTKMLYAYYYAQKSDYDSGTMTITQFVNFIKSNMGKGGLLASYFDDSAKTQINTLSAYVDKTAINKKLTAKQLAKAMGMDESMVKQIFMLKNSGSTNLSNKKMTITAFTGFIVNTVMKDSSYASMFDDATKTQIIYLNTLAQAAEKGTSYSTAKLAGLMGMDEAAVAGIFGLKSQLSGTQVTSMTLLDFLGFIVTNTAANGPLYGTMDTKTLAQVNTAYGIVQSAAGKIEFTYTQFADLFGMKSDSLQQLFMLYYCSPKDNQTMSELQFVNYLLSDVVTNKTYAKQFSKATIASLKTMQTMMTAANKETKLNYSTIASMMGQETSTAKMLYCFYQAENGGAESWKLSVMQVVDFIVKNQSQFASMMGNTDLSQITLAQSLIHGSVDATSYTPAELAKLVGMKADQLNQLYLLYISKHGDTSSWKMSPLSFVDYLVADILSDDNFKDQFDSDTVDTMTSAKKLMHAVVDGTNYTPQEMTSLLLSLSDELDENMISLLYLYQSSETMSDSSWVMNLEQFVDYLADDVVEDERFLSFFDADTKASITDMKKELKDGVAQLQGDKYSILMFTTNFDIESKQTTAFLEEMNQESETKLNGEYYLIGNSPMSYEMSQTFGSELNFITLLTAAMIFVVVALTFRSLVIPTILVLIIQCSVYITMTIIGIQGQSIYYLALLIVQSILMGATIDYGILFTSYYREHRLTEDRNTALKSAYEGSIHTILTSGMILIIVTAVMGSAFSDPATGMICLTISKGALCATILILFIFPGILLTFDRFITKGKKKAKDN